MIYNWINSNRRDSPIWQHGFLTAGGADKLKEFWDEEGSDQEPKGTKGDGGPGGLRSSGLPDGSKYWYHGLAD